MGLNERTALGQVTATGLETLDISKFCFGSQLVVLLCMAAGSSDRGWRRHSVRPFAAAVCMDSHIDSGSRALALDSAQHPRLYVGSSTILTLGPAWIDVGGVVRLNPLLIIPESRYEWQRTTVCDGGANPAQAWIRMRSLRAIIARPHKDGPAASRRGRCCLYASPLVLSVQEIPTENANFNAVIK